MRKPSMNIPKDLTLKHNAITLKMLDSSLLAPMTQMAANPQIWPYATFEPEFFERQWFDRALDQMHKGQRWPFAVEYNSKLVGSSSYYEMDEKHKHLTIGYTWYSPDYWGTDLNPAVKFLLLRYAFEELHCLRVAFTVDQRNIRSCSALKKIGAQQEGVLRKQMILPDGNYRNTVVFSILDEEWSSIKENLLKRIALYPK